MLGVALDRWMACVGSEVGRMGSEKVESGGEERIDRVDRRNQAIERDQARDGHTMEGARPTALYALGIRLTHEILQRRSIALETERGRDLVARLLGQAAG